MGVFNLWIKLKDKEWDFQVFFDSCCDLVTLLKWRNLVRCLLGRYFQMSFGPNHLIVVLTFKERNSVNISDQSLFLPPVFLHLQKSYSLNLIDIWQVPLASVVHYIDVIMSMMASQITSVSIVYSTVCSGPDQRKHQNSMSLAFVRGIHRWLVNSLHNGPVTWKMFPFDDVIMWFTPARYECRV